MFHPSALHIIVTPLVGRSGTPCQIEGLKMHLQIWISPRTCTWETNCASPCCQAWVNLHVSNGQQVALCPSQTASSPGRADFLGWMGWGRKLDTKCFNRKKSLTQKNTSKTKKSFCQTNFGIIEIPQPRPWTLELDLVSGSVDGFPNLEHPDGMDGCGAWLSETTVRPWPCGSFTSWPRENVDELTVW